jgi:hypothetical protein
MSSLTDKPRSLAVKTSWGSIGVALGCVGLFLLFQLVDQAVSFEHTKMGVLTGFLPRAALLLMWGGEALAVLAGAVGFLLIRREDVAAGAMAGIVARNLCGIAVGSAGTLFLWLVVGHVVFGF